MKTLTLTVTLDDDAAEGTLSATVDAPDDMAGSEVVDALLGATEAYMRGHIRDAYEEQWPGGNTVVLNELADQACRLALLHAVMHLPAGASSSFTI